MSPNDLKETVKGQVKKGQNIDQRIQFLQVESMDGLNSTLSAVNQSFDKYTKSQDRLSSRLLALNWILGILTFVGAVAGMATIIATTLRR